MTQSTWQALSAIFQQVYDLPTEERSARLDHLCPDPATRAEVEGLLRAHDLAEQLTDAGHTVTVGDLGRGALELATSRQLGPYTLLGEIGQGGMSTVYLAARADDQFDRLVAIKTLRAITGEEGYERFLAERQVHASLEHPGIARLYGGGTSDRGVPYMEMEYIEGGQPIDAYCDQRGLDAAARLGLVRKVCAAVAYAHHNLVVHRDLKPSNILVDAAGEPKLLDFGISKLLDDHSLDWDPTGVGPGPLTPAWASPEQVAGQPITTASDVYSLGVLLFRLLAGRSPLPRSLHQRVRDLETRVPVPSIESVARGLADAPSEEGGASARAFLDLDRGRRRDLEAIVAKALARRTVERYGAVVQLDDDLRRWQRGEPVSARRPTLAYRGSRWLRRNWLLAGFGATVVATLLVSSLVLATQKAAVAVERDRARAEAAKSERMLGLLVGLFESSDPFEAQGEEISVRDVLMEAEPRIERELASQPTVRASLLETIGRVYLNLGQVDDAERLLDRARGLWLELEGQDSPAVAPVLDLLAQVEIRRGRFDQALELVERGLALRRAAHGPESVEQALGLGQKAYVELLLYRTEEAERTAARALEIFARQPSDEWAEEEIDARFLHAEAVYRRRGRGVAQGLFERISKDSRAQLGASHPFTLRALGKLAEIWAEHPADFARAESYAREKLALETRLYRDEDHADVAVALDVLAGILARKGDLEEAEALLERAVEMRRRLDGEESPFLAISLGNLGWFHLFRRHDPAAAEPHLRQALAVGERYFSPRATLLAYPLLALGRSRTLLGAAREGEPFLRRALDIRRGARRANLLPERRAELFLGENLAVQGRCDEASDLVHGARGPLVEASEPDDLDRLARVWSRFEEHCPAAGQENPR